MTRDIKTKSLTKKEKRQAELKEREQERIQRKEEYVDTFFVGSIACFFCFLGFILLLRSEDTYFRVNWGLVFVSSLSLACTIFLYRKEKNIIKAWALNLGNNPRKTLDLGKKEKAILIYTLDSIIAFWVLVFIVDWSYWKLYFLIFSIGIILPNLLYHVYWKLKYNEF